MLWNKVLNHGCAQFLLCTVHKQWEVCRVIQHWISKSLRGHSGRQEADMLYLTAREVDYLKFINLRHSENSLSGIFTVLFSPQPASFELLSSSRWLLLWTWKKWYSEVLAESVFETQWDKTERATKLQTNSKYTKEDKWRHCVSFFHNKGNDGITVLQKGGHPCSSPYSKKQTSFQQRKEEASRQSQSTGWLPLYCSGNVLRAKRDFRKLLLVSFHPP